MLLRLITHRQSSRERRLNHSNSSPNSQSKRPPKDPTYRITMMPRRLQPTSTTIRTDRHLPHNLQSDNTASRRIRRIISMRQMNVASETRRRQRTLLSRPMRTRNPTQEAQSMSRTQSGSSRFSTNLLHNTTNNLFPRHLNTPMRVPLNNIRKTILNSSIIIQRSMNNRTTSRRRTSTADWHYKPSRKFNHNRVSHINDDKILVTA